MRKSLLETFDKIYILNLHGNSIIGEPDKNIFDITVGVSIAIFVKMPKPLKEKEVYYYSTLDNNLLKRKEKEDYLFDENLKTISWKRLKPELPYYWFIDKDLSNQKQYDEGWGLNKIFKIYNSGIKTDRDSLFIDREKNTLTKRIKILFEGQFDKSFQDKYNVKNSGSYNLLEKVNNNKFIAHNIHLLHYRPFDFRYIYYQVGLTSRPSNSVHESIIDKENVGLIFPRFVKGMKSNYGLITNKPADVALGGSHSGSETYIAPLFIYKSNGNSDENGNGFLFKDEIKRDNFTKEFRSFLKKQKLEKYTPEQILGYIYAIMFSETYRTKYYEFFKIDFPKIPFTDNKKLFGKLSNLGNELIENHLLKRNYNNKEMPVFAVEGNNEINQHNYDDKNQRLYINKIQYFEHFNKSVWEYEIGGYQVIDKYLKSRKGLILTYDEINHLKKVATSIQKTIELQVIIDKLCKGWI
jgi:predicted helicase